MAQTTKKLNPKPNIILITIDTTRADRMGFLGSDRGLTPNLDAVAKQAFVFTRAYSQVPLTTASHAAILTGTYPQFNHINDFGSPLTAGIPYLPDLLHAEGYHTAAFVGSLVLDPVGGAAPGFDRGFDSYDAHFHSMAVTESRYESVERRAEYVIEDALGWLKKQTTNAPFFVWVHLYDPHDPYEPPEPYKSKFRDPYDGEIAYSDAMLGRLFAALHTSGLYDGALIAIMSDHGEAFGEHGERTHGIFLYDETIHVPLLIKMPLSGAASGTAREKPANVESTSSEDARFAGKIDDQVSLVDVAPTLLDVAGLAVPKAVQGQSLLALFKPASAQPVRAIFSESDYPFDIFHWSVLRSWRNGKYLYVEAPKRELYDQASDPKAARNLALTSPAIADTLNAQAESFRKSTTSGAGGPVKLNPEQVAKLSSLGYIASEIRSGTEGEVGGIDPKDRIEIANLFHDGLVFSEEHRYQDAIKALERVVESEPDSGLAYSHLGIALMRAKDVDKALPVLRKAAQLHAESSLNQYQLGRALLQTGKVQESLAHFEKAVELTPSAEYRFSLATVYVRLGRDDDALKQLDMTLENEPNHYRANLLRGAILADYQPSEALSNLQAAAAANPTASEPHAYLAKAYERLGNITKAEEEHRKAKELGGPH